MIGKKKVIIVGAGHIGSAIANMLPKRQYKVTVADGSSDVFAKDSLNGFDTVLVDIQNGFEDFKNLLVNYDYVINAAPYFLTEAIAMAAFKSQTHYFDLTEDVIESIHVRAFAEEKKNQVAFVSQCGLAPGFIGIVANHLASQFDLVLDVNMRVGALPLYPNNKLKYNMTWSIDGLINEYLHPCQAVKSGELVEVDPLEGYENFTLDGDEYEAFNTSGGLGTLCETWDGKVSNMTYKTVRYLGHRDLMKFLIDELKFNEDKLTETLQQAIPSTDQDVVVIYAAVTGTINGKFMQKNWSKKVYGKDGWTAIQRTTASGICAMVELHRKGLLPNKGFVKQEMVNFDEFMNTMAGEVYGK